MIALPGRRIRALLPVLLPALLLVLCSCSKSPVGPQSAYRPRTRHYYVAADEVAWDYAPSPALYRLYTIVLPRILDIMRRRGRQRTQEAIERA